MILSGSFLLLSLRGSYGFSSYGLDNTKLLNLESFLEDTGLSTEPVTGSVEFSTEGMLSSTEPMPEEVFMTSTAMPPIPIVPNFAFVCPGSNFTNPVNQRVSGLEDDKCYEATSEGFPGAYPNGMPIMGCRFILAHPSSAASAQITILKSEFGTESDTGCTKDFLLISGIGDGATDGAETQGASGFRSVRYCGTLSEDQNIEVDIDRLLTILFRVNGNDNDYLGYRMIICYEP